MNIKEKSRDDQHADDVSGAAAAWASLDSLEGIIPATRNWYPFTHRKFVLLIGTESNGNGGERYVFNHPSEWDEKNNRPKRFRRSSKEAIENDARNTIDNELAKSALPGGDGPNPPRRMAQGAARQVVLSLEMLLDRLAPWLKQLPPEVSPIDAIEKGMRLLVEGAGIIKNATPVANLDLPATTDALENKRETPTPSIQIAAGSCGETPRPPAPAANELGLVEKNAELARVAVLQSSPSAEPPPVAAQLRNNRKSKVQWPSKPEFLEMLWLKRRTEIARKLGCDASTVLHKAEELGLPRPETMFWARKKYGDPIEIPDRIKAQIAQLRNEATTVSPSTLAASSEQSKPKSEHRL